MLRGIETGTEMEDDASATAGGICAERMQTTSPCPLKDARPDVGHQLPTVQLITRWERTTPIRTAVQGFPQLECCAHTTPRREVSVLSSRRGKLFISSLFVTVCNGELSCVCVCVCVYIYIYTHIYIYIHVYLYIYIVCRTSVVLIIFAHTLH